MRLFRSIGHGSLILILLSVAHAENPIFPQLRVTPDTIKVRNIDGTQVCSLPRGTLVQPIARDKEADLLQISPGTSNCPATGFIDVRDARPVSSPADPYEHAQVDEPGLALRSDPKVTTGTFKCGLPMDAKLDLLPEEFRGSTTTWFKVKLKTPVSGCPDEGWVSSSYLRPDLPLKDLPVIRNDRRNVPSEGEGVCQRCLDAAKKASDTATAASDILQAAGSGPHGQSPFLAELLKMNKTHKCSKPSEYACNRGLVQMPLVGKNAGFCGTHHYLPDPPPGVDAYAEPMTACALVALAQEWKKTVCPNRGGCTLQWGDISHRTRPRWNGHVDHTDGECVDFRPLRKGGFGDSGLNYKSGNYDRAETQKLIEMAKQMGATRVIFNDPACKAERGTGHANHVHICFGNTPKTRATCQNLQVSPATCPELQ